MRFALVAAAASAFAVCSASIASATVYFQESFDDGEGWKSRWVQSTAKSDYGAFDVSAGKFYADAEASKGLRTTQDARFYAISAPFEKEFDNKDKTLVLQFTAKHEQLIDCGGGYIKVMPKSIDPKTFDGDSPYSIMFGSDICGPSKKSHLILTYKGKNYLINKSLPTGSDQLTHLYTFILKPDQTYEYLLDNTTEVSGKLIEDWDFLPPKMIPDPAAKKPEDWEDDEEIVDPEDKKPDGWDDIPQLIPDPDAKKPDDWDEEEDGEWEPPKVGNTEYKGEWQPKKIKNPKYVGAWVHPEIENPDYALDDQIYHFPDSFYVGFDLWQVKSGTIFDDIIVTDSVEEAREFAEKTYFAKKDAEKEALDKQREEQTKKSEADKGSEEATEEKPAKDEFDEDAELEELKEEAVKKPVEEEAAPEEVTTAATEAAPERDEL